MQLNPLDVVVEHSDNSTRLSSSHTVVVSHIPTGLKASYTSRTAHMAKFMAWDELEELVVSHISIKRDMTAKVNNTNRDQTVAVDHSYHWQLITDQTPRGKKLQLINKNAGVATYGSLGTEPSFWTHWAPLPTFKN